MKAQLQCLPMPEAATPAGECPSGHGMGTRWLQQSPLSASCPRLQAHGGSCPALLQHLLLGDAQGCSGRGDSGPGCLQSRHSGKAKTKAREPVQGWDVGQCSSAPLHFWCWCPARHRAECWWVPCWEGANHWETTEEPKPSRRGVLLLPAPTCSQGTGGKGALLSSGAVQGPPMLAMPGCGFRGAVLALMWFLWLCLCQPRACHAGTHPTLPTALWAWSDCYKGPMAASIWGEGKRGEVKECLL